jgi:transposase
MLKQADGQIVFGPLDFSADRAGFLALLERLRERLGEGDRLMAGVEASGVFDDNLLAFLGSLRAERWRTHVLRLDPAQVAHFGEAHPVRGKTDAADARRIARFTRAYGAELDCFESDREALVMLRLVNERGHLVEDHTAWVNRLKDHLVVCFPELESIFKELDAALPLAVLEEVPTAAEAARRQARTLARVRPDAPRSHRLGEERARAIVRAAKDSVACAADAHDGATVRFAVRQIQALDGRIKEIETALESYYNQTVTEIGAAATGRATADNQPVSKRPAGGAVPAPSANGPVIAPETAGASACPAPLSIPEQLRLADTVPGVAMVGACTVVLRSRGLGRFTCAKALAAQLGACPDRNQTGTSRDRAHLTHRGDRRTRATLYMLTQAAALHDPVMAFHKWLHERKGLRPKQAVCACMNRMARWIYGVAKTRTPFDPQRAVENARRHHRELWEEFLKTVWCAAV